MNIDWTKHKLDNLIAIYSFSNTAAYLLDEFQRDPSYQLIAAGATPQQLEQDLLELLQPEHLSLDLAVRAYICLIALTLAAPDRAKALAESGKLFPLRWGLDIVGIGASRYVKTSLLHVSSYRLPNDPNAPKTVTSTSSAAHNLDPSWRAIVKP